MQPHSNPTKTPSDLGSGAAGRARRSLAGTIAAGREAYERSRHLPRLLPLMPVELADRTPGMQRRIVARLARALRAERTRGRSGHWTYDLNRHIALVQAYLAEREALNAAIRRGE